MINDKTFVFMLIAFNILSGCVPNMNNQEADPKDEDPVMIYPKTNFTDKPTKDGAYVMEVHENQILVIEASPQDFSQSGGLQEFYSAIIYHFPLALEKVKVGQRVIVEAEGPIMESYPAQAKARSVEILPEYRPVHANLSESQVIAKSVEKAKESELTGFLIVRDLLYHDAADFWEVSLRVESGEELKDLTIEMVDK